MTYFGSLKLEEMIIKRHTICPSGDYAPHVLSSLIFFEPASGLKELKQSLVISRTARTTRLVVFEDYRHHQAN